MQLPLLSINFQSSCKGKIQMCRVKCLQKAVYNYKPNEQRVLNDGIIVQRCQRWLWKARTTAKLQRWSGCHQMEKIEGDIPGGWGNMSRWHTVKYIDAVQLQSTVQLNEWEEIKQKMQVLFEYSNMNPRILDLIQQAMAILWPFFRRGMPHRVILNKYSQIKRMNIHKKYYFKESNNWGKVELEEREYCSGLYNTMDLRHDPWSNRI